MKQFTLVFPKSKAEEFAAYSFSNQIRVILSWMEGSDFFGVDKLVAVCQAEDASATALLASEWKNFIKK
jgi:hypothetical protein